MAVALITGGLGFIGTFIARKLLDDKLVDKVVLLDHFGRYVDTTSDEFLDYRRLRIKGIEDQVIVERGEAKYYSVVFELLNRYRPKYIFHLAALPLARLQNLNVEEALEGSGISTSNILSVIGALSEESGYTPERFVYASSSMVYGDFQYTPADEKHDTAPKEIYGTMKLSGEIITKGLSQYYGIKSTIVRPSAVFGPTDMNRRVSQIFLEDAIRGKTIKIQGADEALDFTYVKDVATGFVLAGTSENAIGEIFNITNGKAHTLLEYVSILKEYFPSVQYEVVERDSKRPRRGTLSIEKAKNLLGFQPTYDLKKALEEYIAFVKEHNPALFTSHH
jgi:UDP-glucose 4-epimerase